MDSSSIAYLNGDYLPLCDAKISVLDRGYLFGDAVYEVVPAFDGKSINAFEHFARLEKSCNAVKISVPLDFNKLSEIFDKLLKANDAVVGDSLIYLQISRGVAASRSLSYADNLQPTVFVCLIATQPKTIAEISVGKTAVTLEDIRWKYCNIKSVSMLSAVLLYQQVCEAGCDEAIIIREGHVTEGIASNIFVAVDESMVVTPPVSNEILSGVTRSVVINLMKANGISVKEEQIPEAKLNSATEILVTSSVIGVHPVVKLNHQPVGDGKPGPIWKKIIELYFNYKQAK